MTRYCANYNSIGRGEVLKGKAPKDSDITTKEAIQACLNQKYIVKGDLVVVTAGVPIVITGTTNMIQLHVA